MYTFKAYNFLLDIVFDKKVFSNPCGNCPSYKKVSGQIPAGQTRAVLHGRELSGNGPCWLVTRPCQVGNRQNQPRMKFIVGNWSETSRALVKYPRESLRLGIYSKPMRPIQKSVFESIRVIPNKSKASFNLYQSEIHFKSIRTLNPNEFDESELVQTFNPKLTGFIRIEISDLFGLILNWLRVDSD